MRIKSAVYAAIASVGIFAAAPSWAAAYNFSLTWNGSSYSVDGGATNPVGTNIAINDSFSYKLSAAPTDFWRVLNGGNFFPFFALSTSDCAGRTASVGLKLFNDGTEVFSSNDPAEYHSCVHMGTNSINLASGFEFDQVVMDYTLLASSSGHSNHITNIAWPLGVPFGYFQNIAYIDNPGEIPEPAMLGLLSVGLLGASLASRRRKPSN